MSTQTKATLPAFLCGSAFLVILACASSSLADDIVPLVDEHGHKTYINIPNVMPNAGGSFRPQRSSSRLSPEEVDRLVTQAAEQKQVDPKLVHSIIQVESGYNPNAISRKGAMGLMQLIPGTAKRFGVENPFDPKQNIDGGVSYLKYLLEMFQGDVALSLAAYNAGENSVLRSGGIPAFQETQAYVRKVSSLYGSDGAPNGKAQEAEESPKAIIYRYVDENGIVHYSNGYEF